MGKGGIEAYFTAFSVSWKMVCFVIIWSCPEGRKALTGTLEKIMVLLESETIFPLLLLFVRILFVCYLFQDLLVVMPDYPGQWVPDKQASAVGMKPVSGWSCLQRVCVRYPTETSSALSSQCHIHLYILDNSVSCSKPTTSSAMKLASSIDCLDVGRKDTAGLCLQ